MAARSQLQYQAEVVKPAWQADGLSDMLQRAHAKLLRSQAEVVKLT